MYANMEVYLSGEQIAANGIENVVDDTTPTLGGNLDTGGFTISNIDGGSI